MKAGRFIAKYSNHVLQHICNIFQTQVMFTEGPIETCRPEGPCSQPRSLYQASQQHVDTLFLRLSSEQRPAIKHRYNVAAEHSSQFEL
jgi:hypothetical protein